MYRCSAFDDRSGRIPIPQNLKREIQSIVVFINDKGIGESPVVRVHGIEVTLRHTLPGADDLNGEFLQQGVDFFSFVATVLHNLLSESVD